MRTHTESDEPTLICPICNVEFASKRSLTMHKKDHETQTAEAPKKTNRDRPFECSICKRTFTGDKTLARHKKKQHTSRVHDCEYCREAFETKVELKDHLMRKHTHELKIYKCDKCSREFPLASMLLAHTMRHLSKGMPKKRGQMYYCTSCPKFFTNSLTLKRHTQMHTGEKRKYFFEFFDSNFLIFHFSQLTNVTSVIRSFHGINLC